MTVRASPALTMFVAGAAVLMASCSTAPIQEARSLKAERELAEALTGRSQRAPVRCLPSYRTNQMEIVDDNTILYRDGRTVYVQHPRGGCPGIGFGNYTLVTHHFGSNESCEGDISHVVDLRTGMGGGSCVFGPFIPFTKPS
ncbi:MAG: hypothetical protein H0W65_04005 [Sphingomonas sp.]|uniref:hypothetical protein n=1 Tax=Sphingomonas sp. TaxID=28214 RepID=UPI0017B8E6A6|nr:hypothetical protein [Sphingomonas sp.]MBA3666869.1 hypothetical protein [Sphingomonas sp.]